MVETETILGDFFAHFGDGNTARIIKMKKFKNKEGVRRIRFILQPSSRIKQQYDLLNEDDFDTATGYIMREYDEAEVVFTSNDPGFIRCWIFCDFNANETPATEREQHLVEQIRSLQRSLGSMKVQVVRTQQELRDLTNLQKKHIRGAVEIVNEARKGAKQQPIEDEPLGEEQQA